MNDLLSICIPTYNRAEALRGCLENLIPQAMEHDVPIYVSDNASTDNTREVMEEFQNRYSNIVYSRNDSNIGAEHNIAGVLRMSTSKFSWSIGDKYRLVDGAVGMVLGELGIGDCDLMVVNAKGRVKDIPASATYIDANKLLGDLGWHMTMVSGLVWGRELIKGADFEKYTGTELVHAGVIFDYLADRKFSVRWVAEPLVTVRKYGSGWTDKTFEVFAKRWFNIIHSLPSVYREEVKGKCIKDHGIKSGLFTFMNLVKLRALGILNLNIFKRYYRYFPYVTSVPRNIVFLISVLPAPVRIMRVLKGRFDEVRRRGA